MNDLKAKFTEELHKYVNHAAKGEDRNAITSVIAQLNTNQISIPITQADSPIFKVLFMISSDSNYIKSNETYITQLCLAISNQFFAENCIYEALRAVEKCCNYTSQNSGLKIIQFAATLLPTVIFQPKCNEILFIITISMILHSIPIVSTTAFATTQQMISILFDSCHNVHQKISDNTMKAIVGLNSLEFNNPLLKIPYQLLSGICKLLNNEKPAWISIPNISESILVSLWNIIIISHKEYIFSEPNLLTVVEKSVPIPIISNLRLPLYISVITKYHSKLPEKSAEIFKFFSQQIDPKGGFTIPLVFFKTIFSSSNQFVVDFCQSCDQDYILLTEFLNNLIKFPPVFPSQEVVNFSFGTFSFQNIKTLNIPSTFSITAPLEIAASICLSGSVPLVASTRNLMVQFLVYSLRIASLESSVIIFEAFGCLIDSLYKTNYEEERLEAIRIITNLVAKQRVMRNDPMAGESLALDLLHTHKKGLYFKQKRILGFKMLLALFKSKVYVFEKSYTRLFLALSMFPKNDEFNVEQTKTLSKNELKRMLNVLLKDDVFYIDVMSDVLVANAERLHAVWPESLISLPHTQQTKSAVKNLIINSLKAVDNSQRLFVISAIYDSLIIDENEELFELLNEKIASEPLSVDEQKSALKCFDPKFCRNAKVLKMAFDGFKSVFQSIDNEIIHQAISNVFTFVSQDVNDEISILSIQLIPEMMTKVISNQEQLNYLLSQEFSLMGSIRKEISQSLIDSFFSLLIINSSEFSSQTLEFILTECFIKFIDGIEKFDECFVSIFINIQKYLIQFWEKYKDFKQEIWQMMFTKYLITMKECSDEEFIIKSFEFYADAFAFDKLTNEQINSLINIFNDYVCHVNSNFANLEVLDPLYELFSSVFVEKINHVNETPDVWLNTISLACSNLCHYELSSKYLDLLHKVFPPNATVSKSLANSLSNMIKESKQDQITQSAFGILEEIIKLSKDDFLISLCELILPVFEFESSKSLTQMIIEKFNAKDINASEAESIFKIVAKMKHGPTDIIEQFIITLLPLVKASSCIEFVSTTKDETILMKIWSNFCIPNSKSFNKDIYGSSFEFLFNNLISIAKTIKDEDKLCSILSFLCESSIQPQNQGSKSQEQNWHFHGIIDWILTLVDHKNWKVSQLSKRILSIIVSDINQIIL